MEPADGHVVRNSGVGVDIGGSFAKLVYFRPLSPVELPSYVLKEATTLALKADIHLSINSDQLGGVIRFIRMPVDKVESFAQFVKDKALHNLFNLKDTLNVTGGGAFKFEHVLKDRLGVTINKLDEMKMLVDGLNFVLSHVNNEVFTYSHETKKQTFVPPCDGEDRFPYLLVNIGSGVSILKVSSKDKFQRVSGSSIGGGTFWGLASQLADVTTWDQVSEMSLTGDNRHIDLLVGDIYGTGYEKLGLDANVIASSFAKAGYRGENYEDLVGSDIYAPLNNAKRPDSSKPNGDSTNSHASMNHNSATTNNTLAFSPSSPIITHKPRAGAEHPSISLANQGESDVSWSNADIVKSLLFMICNNIGQVAFLNAQLHQVKRVYFAGGFIQRNPYIWSTLSYAIKYWSKGDMEAMFLVHDGYLGALGALVSGSQLPSA